MARTTVNVNYTNFDGLQDRINALLMSKGYKSIVENNESVWKCGIGFLTAMKYIKIEFADNNTLVISGWIRPVLGKEQDLNGVVAVIPKKQVMEVINQIKLLVN